MRQKYLDKVKKAQKELDNYDEFFSTLEVGQKIYERGAYDDFPCFVQEWDHQAGTITVKTKVGSKMETMTKEYFHFGKELRESLAFF